MKHVAIDVTQETRRNSETVTVAEALLLMSHHKHAGEVEMMQLLEQSVEIPAFLREKYNKQYPSALIFAGTIHTDQHGNDYGIAVYLNKVGRLVSEKYWLCYPMPENLQFALID